MAECSRCHKTIAMAKVPSSSNPKGVWTKFEPTLDREGCPIEVYGRNGKAPDGSQRYAWRLVPSKLRHECGVTSPVPSDSPHRERSETPLPPAPRPDPSPEPFPGSAPQVPSENRTPPAPPPVDLEALEARVRGIIVETLEAYGVERAPERFTYSGPRGEYKSEPGELRHPNLDTLIPLLARSVDVYLYGPSGSTKTFACEQAARVIGRPSAVVTMPGMSTARLLGYMRPDGQVVDTPFTQMFPNGGVLILDEFDRTDPAVAAALNSALANGRYNHGGRELVRHPDFVVAANGNTAMRGATREYTSAKPLDYATAARFRFVEWPYDEALELAFGRLWLPVRPAETLTKWARSLRRVFARDHIELVFAGPREVLKMAEEISNGSTIESAAAGWVFRGLDAATTSRLVTECPYPDVTSEKG